MQSMTACDSCGLEFHFKSKLNRHLRSVKHKNFVGFLQSAQGTSTSNAKESVPGQAVVSNSFFEVEVRIITTLISLFFNNE